MMNQAIFTVVFTIMCNMHGYSQYIPDSVFVKCVFNYLQIRESIHKKMGFDTIRLNTWPNTSLKIPDTTVYGVKILGTSEEELYHGTQKGKSFCLHSFYPNNKENLQYLKIENTCYIRKKRKKHYHGTIQGNAVYQIIFDDKSDTYSIKLVSVYD